MKTGARNSKDAAEFDKREATLNEVHRQVIERAGTESVTVEPVDPDQDDYGHWPDGRGVRRAIFDARRHLTTAMEGHLNPAEATFMARPADRPDRPRPLHGRPSVQQVADHSTVAVELVYAAFGEVERLAHVVQSLLGAALAQQRCLDEITRAIAQASGEKPNILQHAVLEQRTAIQELMAPAVYEAIRELERGIAPDVALRDVGEVVRKHVEATASEARTGTYNVLR